MVLLHFVPFVVKQINAFLWRYHSCHIRDNELFNHLPRYSFCKVMAAGKGNSKERSARKPLLVKAQQHLIITE